MRSILLAALAAPLLIAGCATAAASTAPAAATAQASAAPAGAAQPVSERTLTAMRESPAGAYNLDVTHSSVHWKIERAGLSTYTARFDKMSGTIQFDPANPTASRADITIDATSVNTGLPTFDAKLEEEVFKAGANPQIRFVSTAMEQTGPTTGIMRGDLTMAGVTRPAAFEVRFNGAMNNMFAGGRRTLGFSATTTVNRSEFGSTQWRPFVGDAVTVTVESEFQRAQ